MYFRKTRSYRIYSRDGSRVGDGHHVGSESYNIAVLIVHLLVYTVGTLRLYPPHSLKVDQACEERPRYVPKSPPCPNELYSNDHKYHAEKKYTTIQFQDTIHLKWHVASL